MIHQIIMKGRKNRDDDLLLFKELHKHENDRLASLLQPPVSEEFEPKGGNNPILKINPFGKKGSGYELFGENDKNDFDWLKTPPATPLFPSLEMEVAPQLLLQREIPMVPVGVQPLSRFATSTEASKGNRNSTSKKPAKPITPSNQRRSNPKLINLFTKPTPHKQTRTDSQAKVKTNTISNVVSPNRGLKSDRLLGFSSQTPPNLRTDRATSATRGRPVTIEQKTRRQSCSPSAVRGRTEASLKGKFQTASGSNPRNNGTQILLGSRMVDKLMTARKLGAQERESKPKPLATTNKEEKGGGGFASSLDKALKLTV